MNSTIIKFLVSLKNDSWTSTDKLTLNYDCFSLSILKVLYTSGLIQGYTVLCKNKVVVFLRKSFNKTLTQNIKLVSTPTYKMSVDYKKIALIRKNTNSILFFSTDRGLLTSSECKKYKICGVLLFTC
jgi:ribosomal protein S8